MLADLQDIVGTQKLKEAWPKIEANEQAINAEIVGHKASDAAHNATAIVFTPGESGIDATTVDGAIKAIDTHLDGHETSVTAHNSTSIVFTPGGSGLIATDVDSAIKELDTLVDAIQTGDSGPAANAARLNSITGITHDTLKDRLDSEFEGFDEARESTPYGVTYDTLKDRVDHTDTVAIALKADVTQRGINVCSAPYNADPTGVIDSTTAIQLAIDAAIQTTGLLYFPQGTYRITGTLYVWGTIRIVGAKGKIYGQPTVINYFGNGVAIHFQKKNSASGPLIEGTNIGGIFVENINIQRSFSGDGAFGTQGVGYNFHYVSEGSFDKVGVTGFKVGHQCQGLTIFEFNKCDILFCQYGTALRKTSVVGGTEIANTQVSYNACNFYMNDETHVLAGGAKVSFFQCHMEQSKATFLFDGTVNNNPIENFVVQACNMRNHTGDMGTEYTDSRILKFVGGVSLTFILDNIHFFDNFCKLKGDNAVPIEILTNANSNMTVFIDMENNTFYGAPLGIVVSDSVFQPAIDFGYRRVRKEDGSVYSPAVPDMTNGKKLGWMTASDRNRVSGVIQLGDNTQITENEGALYYDYVGHIPKVRGQNRTQNLLPMTFGTAAPTSGTYTLLDVVFNSSPSRTKNISHWKPTAAGTPGTWRAFGCGNGTTAERTGLTMATGDAGYTYFDTDLAKMVMWSGTAWLV